MPRQRPSFSPHPVPEPRPGWTAIVGRIGKGETTIAALYPAATLAGDAPTPSAPVVS